MSVARALLVFISLPYCSGGSAVAVSHSHLSPRDVERSLGWLGLGAFRTKKFLIHPEDHGEEEHGGHGHGHATRGHDHHEEGGHHHEDPHEDAVSSTDTPSEDEGHHHEDPHEEPHHGFGDEAHGAHDSHDGGLLKRSDQGAPSVAVGLIASAVLVPIVCLMVLNGGIVMELTVKMLDTFVAIFLAVLWFNATSDFFSTDGMRKAFPYAEEVFTFLQVVILYFIALAIAYQFRDKETRMITFCSICAHYIAFAGIKSMGETQHEAQHEFDAYKPLISFGFVLAFFAILAVLFLATESCWRSKVENEKYNEAIEELELDVIGLTISFGITQALRHAIVGRYPPSAHLFLQRVQLVSLLGLGSDEGTVALSPEHVVHEPWQRWFMLVWSVSLTVLMAFSLTPLEEIREKADRMTGRLIHVFRVVLVMCVAWGYLLWAEWEFHEVVFHGDPMFGHMVFAVAVSVITLGVIAILGMVDPRCGPARHAAHVSITAFALMAAWSWEHCFDMALDVIGDVYDMGYGGLIPKTTLAVLLPVCILPVYVLHLKPWVIAIEERQEEQAKQRRVANSEPDADAAYVAPVNDDSI